MALSQHALLSIISISVLHGISYSGPNRYKERGRGVREAIKVLAFTVNSTANKPRTLWELVPAA